MTEEYRAPASSRITCADLSRRAANVAQTNQPIKRTPAEMDALMKKAERQKALDDHLAPLKAHFKTFFIRSDGND